MGTQVTFQRPDGRSTNGYLAKPGRAHPPGLVVVQEWWGLQDQIRGLCDRFAAAGFEALAPDLYGGRTVPYHDAQAAGELMASLDFTETTDQILRGAAAYLGSAGAKVGLTGFCMGGAITILGAIRNPEFAAAVCFYGLPPAEISSPADIRVPLQAHFANRDDWCTPAEVDKFAAAAAKAEIPVEIFRYEAEHGFVNEERSDAHDRACAEDAWQRTIGFFERYLSSRIHLD